MKIQNRFARLGAVFLAVVVSLALFEVRSYRHISAQPLLGLGLGLFCLGAGAGMFVVEQSWKRRLFDALLVGVGGGLIVGTVAAVWEGARFLVFLSTMSAVSILIMCGVVLVYPRILEDAYQVLAFGFLAPFVANPLVLLVMGNADLELQLFNIGISGIVALVVNGYLVL